MTAYICKLACLVLSIQLLLGDAATADTPTTSIDGSKAAKLLLLELNKWNSLRRECTRIDPEHEFALGTTYVTWLEDNRDAIRGLLAYAEQSKRPSYAFSVLSDSRASESVTRTSRQRGESPVETCRSMFGDLRSGELDFKRQHANEVRILEDLIRAHPLSVHGARAYDNPMGCAKAGLNNRVNLDAIIPLCRCNWDALKDEWTLSEWEEFENLAKANATGEVQALPQYKRALPKLAVCANRFSPQ